MKIWPELGACGILVIEITTAHSVLAPCRTGRLALTAITALTHPREKKFVADDKPVGGGESGLNGDLPAKIETSSGVSGRSRRNDKTGKGILFRLTAVAVVLVGTAITLSLLLNRQKDETRPGRPREIVVQPANDRFASKRNAKTKFSNSQTQFPDAIKILDSLDSGIVKIEADRPGDNGGLGSGFVIDESGLVATSYHVIAEATRARVRFKDGAVYAVAGYAAVAPDIDLAIIKLTDPPPNLQAMRLRSKDDPRQLARVVAVGHPHGIEFSTYDGTVSNVVNTSQLPGRSRQFLSRLIGGKVDHRWIQHTARISEGYSGGPLLNNDGEVIGVNTWIDRQTGSGYALHIRHLRGMHEQLSKDVEPLKKYARRDARQEQLIERLSGATVQRLFETAQAMNWRPSSEADYQVLQDLAWAVTFSNLPGTLVGEARRGGLNKEQVDELINAAERVVEKLKKQKWTGLGQLTFVNDFAAEQVDRDGAGVFFFGSVERIVKGDDGSQAAIVKLAGWERPLFLPLDGQLIRLSPGDSCLVLGVNYNGRVVRYGDNPLKPIVAPIIVSRTILPLTEK